MTLDLDKSAIRDAATIILIRDPGGTPSVLMGQRGAAAAFLPSKFVFPGGAVDPEDADVALAGTLSRVCAEKLAQRPVTAPAPSPHTLATAAIRELWEETGLRLARPAPGAPSLWGSFHAANAQPDPSALRFVFRALTPPGAPRRFDARFFLAHADAVLGDLDDFSHAGDELSHLHWVPLAQVRALDLPFITEVVLAEVQSMLPNLDAPKDVPFIVNDDTSRIVML